MEKQERKTTLKDILKSIIIPVIIICILTIAISIYIKRSAADAPGVVTEEYLSGKLEEISELAVSKVTYEGVVQMSDSGIFINKEFYLKYTGHIKCSVDFSKIDIHVKEGKNREIIVDMPHATVGEPVIDNDYQIYDSSWFKSDSVEAVEEALKRAEEDCKNKVDQTAMIETADKYAEEAVENLLSAFENLEEPYRYTLRFK